jgi:O-acetylhomoserine/O-acetylserine sulfhydrylase-like pyridoxal-dependent enzyme
VAEVRKAATEQKKSTRVITSVVGAVASLEGGIYGAAMAAGAGAGGGAIVGIAAATMLVVLLLTCLYGWTVGAWISKRGFVRIIESKLNKELMKDVD